MQETVVGIQVLSAYTRILFFFQAEDGIRDSSVTGVQTCALPIYPGSEWTHAFRRIQDRCVPRFEWMVAESHPLRSAAPRCLRTLGSRRPNYGPRDRKSVV